MKKIASLFILSLLSACSVGPDFVRPDPPAVDSYDQVKTPEKIGSQEFIKNLPVSEKWWKEFASSELDAVVERGIQNSHSLTAMRKNMQQAAEALNAEEALMWPSLGLTAGGGRQKYGASFLGNSDFIVAPFTYYEVGPSLTYLVDIFGGTRRAIEGQQALAEYQGHAYNAAYLTLTGKIVSTSLSIAILNAEIDAANAMVGEDKKNLELVQQALKLGAATQNQVLSAKAQLTTDESLLPKLNLELSKTKNQLIGLVGTTPAQWQPPNFQLKHFKLPNKLPMSLPSELVRKRPDILAAESVLHAANANVGIATANMYPSITLTGNYFQEALTPQNLFLASSGAWSFFGGLTAPIFNAGLLKAQKRSAVLAYEASYSNYQDVVVKALIQVSDVLHALDQDQEAAQLAKQNLDTAQAAVDLARKNFSAGGIGTLPVLSSSRRYSEAQLAYAAARGQRYQDTLQLYLALGGQQSLEKLR